MASKEQVSLHVAELQRNPGALEAIMLRCFENDTDQIKTAEEILKQYTKNPSSFPVLMGAMQGSSHEQVRQLAAVLLKKKILAHWSKFSPEEQSGIAAALLLAVSREPSRSARNSMATLIATLSKHLYEESTGWPELLQFIAQCADQNQSEDHRELAFILLQELTETLGDALKEHFPSLKVLFLKALADPSPKVQVGGLRSSSSLLSYLSMDKDALIFADLIPSTLSVAQQCVSRSDETSVCHVMDVLADLCNSPLPIINPYLTQVVEFILCVLRDATLEMSTRDAASLVLSTLAEFKPKALGKTGLVAPILSLMVELIASYTGSAANSLFTYEALAGGDDDDNDESFDGPNAQGIAQSLLDQLALSLDKKYVFPPAMEICGQCFSHQNAHMRKAGVALIGVITEGCNESIRMNLDQILPRILAAALDVEPVVRECACFCLGQLSEHCQPDILDYHAKILPVVFQLLDDANDNVKGVSCYVLEMFCENLQPDTVLPFLDPLMRRLVQMLQTPKRAIQEMSVAAIAATAIAAEKAFSPYIEGTVTLISQMLKITDESMLTLRGRALECMGHIAIAVDADNFRPFVGLCMQSASESLKIDNVELHEFAYTFFANLAKVLKTEMAPYMPELIPHLVSEINASDSAKIGGASDIPVEEEDDDDDDSDSEVSGSEIDAEEYSKMMNIRTAELDQKKAALLALGALAEQAPAPFEPSLPLVMQCLEANAENFHSEIRMEVCDTLKAVASVSLEVHQPGHKWVVGQTTPLHPHTVQLNGAIIELLMKIMKEDNDAAVVAHACEALRGILEKAGPMALTPHINDLMLLVAMVLTDKAPCQLHEIDDESSGQEGRLDEEEEEDVDGVGAESDLSEAIADLVGGLARVIGPPFTSFFDTFLPMLIAKTKGKSTGQERKTAMGAIGEVLQVLGPVGPRYLQVVLPAIKKCLKDTDSQVVRNTCFCAGVVAEGAGESITPHVMELLQLLAPVFHTAGKGTTEGGLLDNAAAAVARLVMAAPNAVPMDQVLPALLGALPLKVDEAENETVYGCIIGLLNMGHPVAIASLPSIMNVLAKALSEDSIANDEMKQKIVSGLREPVLMASLGPQMSASLEQIPPELAQILRNRLGG